MAKSSGFGSRNSYAQAKAVVEVGIPELVEKMIRKDFTPSERVAIAAAVAEMLGERQGKRTDLGHGDNCPEVAAGRTRDIVAGKSGFSSGKQYERAKAVVEEGIPELVEKMDAGEVSVSAAATRKSTRPARSRRYPIDPRPRLISIAGPPDMGVSFE